MHGRAPLAKGRKMRERVVKRPMNPAVPFTASIMQHIINK